MKEIILIIENEKFESKEVEISVESMHGIITQKIVLKYNEWSLLIQNNAWIKYFINKNENMKGNWIDFEQEISKAIQVVDKARKQRIEENDINLLQKQYEVLKNIVCCKFGNEKNLLDIFKTVYLIDDFIIQLESDLNKLIRELELYLVMFVEKIHCNIISPDIRKVMVRLNKEVQLAELSNIVSFNYTHTFDKIYGFRGKFVYDFIHGEAKGDRDEAENNMVLGIDEYLSAEQKNKEITFIAFKKFYQRIYKQTGCEYKNWVSIIKQDEGKKARIYDSKDYSKDYIHNLYIFGHSLDITDGDILRELILNDNMITTIFYKDKEQLGKQIANLVKIIGQDELIKRTGGSAKTIEFKLQKDMINGKIVGGN